MTDSIMHNPGSELAVEHGCTCPVVDNNYGAGILFGSDPIYWIDASCKLHGNIQEEYDVSDV